MRPFIFLILIVLTTGPAAAQQIRIQMRGPSVSCHHKTVHIRDVAELSGGSPYLREKIAALDLDEFDSEQRPLNITRKWVRYRAVMAGVSESHFTISGPPTIARYSAPINATRWVEQSLLEHLAHTFQIPIDSLELKLLTPIEPLLSRSGMDLSTLTVSPQFPAELPLGTRTLEMTLSDAMGRSRVATVSIKTAVYRDLVMARENISRGEVLAEEKLERVRRPIDRAQVNFASFEQVIGKQAQNDIQQFTLVKSRFVRDIRHNTAAHNFDVKRNAVMSVVIRRGPLVVTLKDARATENGRIGDYINLTNPKSKETLRAKIMDASTAMIEL